MSPWAALLFAVLAALGLLFASGCSDSGMVGAPGITSSDSAENDDKEENGSALEPGDDSEAPSAPVRIAGAYLVCGPATPAEALALQDEVPPDNVLYGCMMKTAEDQVIPQTWFGDRDMRYVVEVPVAPEDAEIDEGDEAERAQDDRPEFKREVRFPTPVAVDYQKDKWHALGLIPSADAPLIKDMTMQAQVLKGQFKDQQLVFPSITEQYQSDGSEMVASDASPDEAGGRSPVAEGEAEIEGMPDDQAVAESADPVVAMPMERAQFVFLPERRIEGDLLDDGKTLDHWCDQYGAELATENPRLADLVWKTAIHTGDFGLSLTPEAPIFSATNPTIKLLANPANFWTGLWELPPYPHAAYNFSDDNGFVPFWTGAKPGGERGNTCSEWRSDSRFGDGSIGNAAIIGSELIEAERNRRCSNDMHVMCVSSVYTP